MFFVVLLFEIECTDNYALIKNDFAALAEENII